MNGKESEIAKYDGKYLTGFKNRMIRYYYYLQNGLTVLNDFRNLFLGIIGLYLALKLTDYLYLIYMAIPCIIILTVVGYYTVHKVSKVRDWLNVRFGSHYSIMTFDYQKGSYELLEEIKELLKKNGRE